MRSKVTKIGNSFYALLPKKELDLMKIDYRDDIYLVVTKIPKEDNE